MRRFSSDTKRNGVRKDRLDLYGSSFLYAGNAETNRKNQEIQYEFSDKWKDMNAYLEYMKVRLEESRRVLKDTGSIFVHCDRNASHYLKVLMDSVFGIENFQSEIIWSYKRWSNSKKGY